MSGNQLQLFSHDDLENYQKMKQEIAVISDHEMIDYYSDLTSDYSASQLFPELQEITVMENINNSHNVAESQVLILQDTPTEAQISFSQFKKETNHKHVKFTWQSKRDNDRTFESETEKFYCNKYKDQLSLPKFGMSSKQTWTKVKPNIYKAESEYGFTVFEVLN